MTHRKSQPKERYVRQRATREARRALAAINPSICHPQQQSPFFAKLPAEIRSQIYQLALSQQWDLSKPIDKASVPPRYRPGHTHHTCISTTLLRTCRLVYCEAHAIPMRSFSHHCRRASSFTRSFGSSDYLYDITKQQGAELYHLHSHLNMWQLESFLQFLQPHYCWRRITWTVHIERLSGYLPSEDGRHIVEALERVVLPASCHEVNLELETRVGIKGLGPPFMSGRPHAEQHTDVCKSLALKKTDGTVLQIDPTSSVGYSWTLPPLVQSNYSSRLYTSRLCWRDEVPRRMYTGYDLLDCLRIQGTRCEIEEIHPLV